MPAQSDTGSFFSETSNQNERILFTSESVGEGHPGKSLYLACFFLLNILHPPPTPNPSSTSHGGILLARLLSAAAS